MRQESVATDIGDMNRWIDTLARLADCLSNTIKPYLLEELVMSNHFDMTDAH